MHTLYATGKFANAVKKMKRLQVIQDSVHTENQRN